MNKSEKLLSAVSEVYFFKELVQDDLCFIPKGDTEHELADLLINLGDLIIAIQLKARNETDQTTNQETELKWLAKKCKVAKKQIKDTISFIMNGELPAFQNLSGNKILVRRDAEIISLIIFINSEIKQYPHILNKHSSTGACVNCISFEEFQFVCRVLVTPIEIISYLEYRQRFYEKHPNVDLFMYTDENDDIILAKPMNEEALVLQFLAMEYNVKKVFENESYLTEFQVFLHKLPKHTVVKSEENANYFILLFLAHLSRIEIKEFLKRVDLAIESSRDSKYGIVGSTRRTDNKYVVFYVASEQNEKISMEYLLDLARQKSDVQKLLQVVVYWENNIEYRIDYFLWDYTYSINGSTKISLH